MLPVNLVNITDEYTPDDLSFNSNYKCIAELYNINNSKTMTEIINNGFRDIIKYNFDSTLNWHFFKASPKLIDSIHDSYILTTIYLYKKNVNVWTGVTLFDACGIMYSDVSWVKPDKMTIENLKYQQLQFDLAELFALKSKKYINNEKINGIGERKMTNIYNLFFNEFMKEQKECEFETNYGKNISKVLILSKKVDKELLDLKD